MKKLKQIWFILILFILGFYLPPLFEMKEFIAVGGIAYGLCFVLAFLFGILRGFNYWLPISVAVLVLPAALIFYDYNWYYAGAATAMALAGNGLGYMAYCARKEKKNEDANMGSEQYTETLMFRVGDYVPKEKKKR